MSSTYDNLFSGDATVRKVAINDIVRSRGKEGLVEILDDIIEHICALENP